MAQIVVDSEKLRQILVDFDRYCGDLAAARIARLIGDKESEVEYVGRICNAEYWKVNPPEARTEERLSQIKERVLAQL